jgi:hypothetical protein
MADFNAIAKQFTGRSYTTSDTWHAVQCITGNPNRTESSRTDFYYNTFDGDRAQLASVYVSLSPLTLVAQEARLME